MTSGSIKDEIEQFLKKLEEAPPVVKPKKPTGEAVASEKKSEKSIDIIKQAVKGSGKKNFADLDDGDKKTVIWTMRNMILNGQSQQEIMEAVSKGFNIAIVGLFDAYGEAAEQVKKAVEEKTSDEAIPKIPTDEEIIALIKKLPPNLSDKQVMFGLSQKYSILPFEGHLIKLIKGNYQKPTPVEKKKEEPKPPEPTDHKEFLKDLADLIDNLHDVYVEEGKPVPEWPFLLIKGGDSKYHPYTIEMSSPLEPEQTPNEKLAIGDKLKLAQMQLYQTDLAASVAIAVDEMKKSQTELIHTLEPLCNALKLLTKQPVKPKNTKGKKKPKTKSKKKVVK